MKENCALEVRGFGWMHQMKYILYTPMIYKVYSNQMVKLYIYPLVFNIAMGNGPFVDGSPIKNCDFPWLC